MFDYGALLHGTGTTFYGMYGTWNRAPMGAGNDAAHTRFVTSEMWAANSSRTAWVEVGHASGFVLDGTTIYRTGYRVFTASQATSGVYDERSFGLVTPNSSVTDEFQISRSSTTNRWNVYFNGAVKLSPAVGFWNTPQLDVGGEVATSYGTSDTFTMYVKGHPC